MGLVCVLGVFSGLVFWYWLFFGWLCGFLVDSVGIVVCC